MVNGAKCTIHGSSGIKNWMGPYQRTPFSKLLARAIRFSGFFGVRSGTVLSKISWNKHIPQMVVKMVTNRHAFLKSVKNNSPKNQQIQVDWPSRNPPLKGCVNVFFQGPKPSPPEKFGGNFNYVSLRIQICPKKGINPTILLWGWDWDHQTYSREGCGSLGYTCCFVGTCFVHRFCVEV